MLLKPSQHTQEWKSIMCLMIDFHKYKSLYINDHLDKVKEIDDNNEQLGKLTAQLFKLIDLRQEIEKKKVIYVDQEQQLLFQKEELQIELELAQTEYQEINKEDQNLQNEEEELIRELEQLKKQSNELCIQRDKAKSYIVSSPEKLSNDRDLSREELTLVDQELIQRQKVHQKLQYKLDGSTEKLNQVKEYLSILQSALYLKETAQTAKRDITRQQSHLVELKSNQENLSQEYNTLRNAKKSKEQKEQQYQEHYQKLKEETQQIIDSRKLDKLDLTQMYEQLETLLRDSKDKCQLERREQMKISRIREHQLSESLRGITALEEYIVEYCEIIKNKIINLPEMM
ncbi:UNKNOWN [Stylonychia lemnae]|uniref:Uncharacterized protein n=1 Tax=Stylonychia lemnae TaxID=5949 RepID=A0A077ZYY6_STYLE|nr:UNKNOWN [Stylonychia lemnae]|eukprot:CDW75171.1 UNKNOWN [Stylonychia lemnae]